MRHAAWLLALCQIAVWVVVGIALSAGWHQIDAQDRVTAEVSPLSEARPSAPALRQTEQPGASGSRRQQALEHDGAAGVVEVEAYLCEEGVATVRRGCGVLVTRKGHIFVPLPVIRGADAVVITFSSGLRAPARRLASDGQNQLALLKALVLPSPATPLTLSDRAYPVTSQQLMLLRPGASVFYTESAARDVGGSARNTDPAYEIVAPPDLDGNDGALLDDRGELVGLVLGAATVRGTAADLRLLVLPVAEIRHSIERILRGNAGTMLERLPDAPSV